MDENNEETQQPLLTTNTTSYYENCPGCQIDLFKETNPRIPFKLLFYVWIIVLCAALPISSLFPFLYFMLLNIHSLQIRDFHIAKREEDIGYYAGYVGSAYMFGRALTSVLWGVIADRYGRKPVIIFGMITLIIFNTLFGLSTSFWMAISTRFLLGSLCGILGPMRAYASEVCRKEYQALGMSIISTSWGIGLVMGPALGGFLAQPAEKYENVFPKDSLFGRFPYFLPCLLISIFGLGVFVLSFSLPETLHNHKGNDEECHDSYDKPEMNEGKSLVSEESLLKNWPLMSSIIVYCVFQLHDMAYAEVLTVPLLASYPFIALLKGLGLTLLIDCASVLKNVLCVSITTGLFLLQNRAVAQKQRGAANGISMSAMSFFKAVGPASGGSIFSWAQKRQDAFFLPGDQIVFFILNIVEVIGLLMTFKPFLAIPENLIS
ncbi:protein ZINC INDUCED FACILITATOR-LIKE 1 isoform X4 [Hevea brasiliensis]|uniref:protein ZINC INDUCED FACILITATOR-LIKE 1 isoform X4 n=1 Tax=Hevea brasiliensis TaxID=3981 RepID=UPI0025E05562|nr:protein ZINC INDUCED FACILITATOR-LIKE 1 isoform X4 [Hevea brasiliensis]